MEKNRESVGKERENTALKIQLEEQCYIEA